jgi:hypothetical protein
MKKKWVIVVCLLLITVLTRLPFYFVDVVDWDESTFILMGQSVLDGHLPYLELWDVKPPLAFVAYAAFIALLGKSLVAIRLAGTICVFITSWLVYSIGKYISDRRGGIFAAILFIVATALISGGQATMTEHVALVPLVGALAWLIRRKTTPMVLLVGGILLTMATLVRLNLAYVVVAVGFWLVYGKLKLRVSSLGIIAYCLGSFGLIFLTYLPYLVTSNGSVWLDSVVLAPLSYSDSSGGITQVLLACLIAWILVKLWQSIAKDREFSLLQVFFLGTAVSILQGGAFYQHYYIQAFPFLALTLALFWTKLPSKFGRLVIIMLVTIGLTLEMKPILLQYQVIGDRVKAKESLTYGMGYEIAKYLKQQNPQQQSVYLMTDHIAYWLANLEPIAKSVTHPSNISKEYLLQHIPGSATSTSAELARILAKKPKFMIKPVEVFYLPANTPAELLLRQTLALEYQVVAKIGDRQVYQILDQSNK